MNQWCVSVERIALQALWARTSLARHDLRRCFTNQYWRGSVPIYFTQKVHWCLKNLRGKATVEDSLMIACAELIALVMRINMSIYIRNALKPNVPSEKFHNFTGSLLNLQRVQRGLGKCNPCEEKQVQLILENWGESSISFCPGVLNPANLPSRGCWLSELFERLPFWKKGPDFLKLDQSKWLKQPKPTGAGDLIMQPKDEWGRDLLFSTNKSWKDWSRRRGCRHGRPRFC